MLSVVIPVFNEAESLEALHRELAEVARAESLRLDMVFVDDGSTDGSWTMIERLAAADPRVRGIRFRRNFGKAAALSAGFAAARGRAGDDARRRPAGRPARDPPLPGRDGQGPRRGQRLEEGAPRPVAQGAGPSRVFNWMVSRLTGVKLHDHNCGMKCYRREVFRRGAAVRRAAPLRARAGRRAGLPRRRAGRSSTGRASSAARSTACARFVKGFLDLLTVKFLTGFGQRPQHLLGTLGLASFLAGGAGPGLSGRVLGRRRGSIPGWAWPPLHERPAVIYSLGACCCWAGN